MTWIVLIALVIVTMAALMFLMRGKREGWEAVAAALMVGLAGYALQGQPGMPSRHEGAQQSRRQQWQALVEERQKLSGEDPTKPLDRAGRCSGHAWAICRSGNGFARRGGG
jgi:cytochrome c-type biogenesis protein CcmH